MEDRENKKVNILFVLPNFDTGGSEKLVVDLVTHLDRDKFNPVVCAFFSGVYEEKMQELGVSFYKVHEDGRIKSKITIVKFLNHIIREHSIDVVNTHHTSTLLQGLLSFKLFNRVKLIHTEHTRLDYDPHITPRVLKIQKVFMKFIDVALGISQGVCDYMHDELGVPKKKIVKVLNGIDVERFQSLGLDVRCQMRDALGMDQNDVAIGMFANFRKQKNHPLLLKAVKILKDKGIENIKVVLAGDGPERENIESLIEALGLRSSVLLLGSRSDIPELMNMIDIYCLPSYFEGLPFSLMEAFAAGKQVVATDVAGNQEVVEEMGEGVLVESDNQEELVKALAEIIDHWDPQTLRSSSSRALEGFPFSFNEMINKYEELFLIYEN